jgi:hypothetical protein
LKKQKFLRRGSIAAGTEEVEIGEDLLATIEVAEDHVGISAVSVPKLEALIETDVGRISLRGVLGSNRGYVRLYCMGCF